MVKVVDDFSVVPRLRHWKVASGPRSKVILEVGKMRLDLKNINQLVLS